ncbi:hydrolase, partial [Streptomyces diastatochromogenes]
MAAPPAYSLIATDLDGTLLRDDDTVSDRSRGPPGRGAGARVGPRRPGPAHRPRPA